MTPLMHAAYRGNLQICRKLLEHKADVNWNCHKDGVLYCSVKGNVAVYIRAKYLEMLLKTEPNCYAPIVLFYL